MSHVLDDWWKGKTFEIFQQLPRELRQIIWEMSIPARYINPRPQGSIAFPGPPAAAYVNSESRGTVLRLGGPYIMDYNDKKDIGVWFTPTRDVILHESHATGSAKTLSPLSAWNVAQKVVLRLNNMATSTDWGDIRQIITLPKLKEVLVIPTATRAGRRLVDPIKWLPHIKSDIFEEDTYRLVSLDNPTEVNELAELLRTESSSRYAGSQLRWTSTMASAHLQDLQQLDFREGVTAKFEEHWLRHKSVPFTTLQKGTIVKTPAVFRALDSMPAIRFVSAWFDFSCEIPARDHGVRRFRRARVRRYIYNHEREIRKWQEIEYG